MLSWYSLAFVLCSCYPPRKTPMKVLMCRPDYFDIEYEINPWMKRENRVDKQRALEQWTRLFETYQNLGVQIELIDQVQGLPDMVFTANAGVVEGRTFVSSHFRHKERQGEEIHFQHWFRNHGYDVRKLTHFQGGEGDALFFRSTHYMGYGFRSDIDAHRELAETIGGMYISLHLIDPYFYDFDTAFCPLGEKGFLYYPHAFDETANKALGDTDGALTMTKEQAFGFVGNSVYVDGKLLASFLDDDLKQKLSHLSIEPILLDVSEFKKAGGGIKCLTLFIER